MNKLKTCKTAFTACLILSVYDNPYLEKVRISENKIKHVASNVN